MRYLLIVFAIFVCPLSAQERESTLPITGEATQARIYYKYWNLQARFFHSAAAVRELPDMMMTIDSPVYASDFVNWLRLDEMQSTVGDEEFDRTKDVKLVVDVFYLDGTSQTFLSDGMWLYNEDETLMRSVDAAFLCKFHFRSWNYRFEEIEEARGGGCEK